MLKRSLLKYDFYVFLVCCVIGYIFGSFCRSLNNDVRNKDSSIENDLLLIAVKSTRRSLVQYGDSILRTWGSTMPGNVGFVFFLDHKPYNGPLHVINLADVDDNDSTTVKKTFSILNYLSETYSQHYEWFLIIEDNTFVHTERLEALLRKTNSRNKNWYMGRLMKNESYCENDNGILLSSNALRAITPHLNQCVHELQNNQDDILLGRCMKQYLGITCTGAVEFNEMFVNNKGGYFNPEKTGSDQTLFLHPVKPQNMYQWMRYYQIQRAGKQRIKVADLEDEIISMNSRLTDEGNEKMDNDDDDVKAEAEIDELQDVEVSGNETKDSSKSKFKLGGEIANVDARVDGYKHPYTFWKLLRSGYTRDVLAANNEARRAVEAVAPMKNWVVSPPRYILYSGGKTVRNMIIMKNREKRIVSSYLTDQKYLKPDLRESDLGNDLETIWIILPLFKKVSVFKRFLDIAADAIEKFDGKVVLRVVLNIDSDGEWHKNQKYAKQMQRRINLELILSKQRFDRGTSKALGTKELPMNSLLVFVDVDMYFDACFLSRVRLNTIYNKQVYFPICFSQYDPKIICFHQKHCQINVTNFENLYGFWRDFGYGMVSMYKKDYVKIGGFDLTIKGWGDEDVDLNSRCFSFGLRVFRAIDPSLVHIYHTKQCDKSLPHNRHHACVGSDQKHAGYEGQLSKIVEIIQTSKTK